MLILPVRHRGANVLAQRCPTRPGEREASPPRTLRLHAGGVDVDVLADVDVVAPSRWRMVRATEGARATGCC